MSTRRRARRRARESEEGKQLGLAAFLGAPPKPVAKPKPRPSAVPRAEARPAEEAGPPRLFRIDPSWGIPCEVCGRSSAFMIRAKGEEHYFCEDHIEQAKARFGITESAP